MTKIFKILISTTLISAFCGCVLTQPQKSAKIRVIIDSDANNELDDQHAIAYALFSGDVFDVVGITVNSTRSGGDVTEQRAEAERIVKLCGVERQVEVLSGADGSFAKIRDTIGQSGFDGEEAVDFIIENAMAADSESKLVLLPVGKLTNIALALAKNPAIAGRVRIVWLGSNYPEPGEYNQDNDPAALNYILDCDVPFEIAVVRYGKASGTDAVRASLDEIKARMPGLGPDVAVPVTGRKGGMFTNFGDYSVDLFVKMGHASRALFDMAAVAVVKNPAWADTVTIPAPILEGRNWRERPTNPRRITIWENFDRDAIMTDFYSVMRQPVVAK